MPVEKRNWKIRGTTTLTLIGLVLLAQPASADLVVSQLIVDLDSTRRTSDVEIQNDSEERRYVVIEPSEIIAAGTPSERRVEKRDPKDLGLLVSSKRLVLEPRQRRMMRLAMIGQPTDRERVYRVTIRPVVGDVSAPASGLKVLVGYDMLVLVRPGQAEAPSLSARRVGGDLTLTNNGNTSVELTDGEYCRLKGPCQPLPGKRLYAGASWTQPVGQGGTVSYKLRAKGKWMSVSF